MAELGLEPTRPPKTRRTAQCVLGMPCSAPSPPLSTDSLIPLDLRDRQALDSTSQGRLLCPPSRPHVQGQAFLLRLQGSHENPRVACAFRSQRTGPPLPSGSNHSPSCCNQSPTPSWEARSTAGCMQGVPCAHRELSWQWDRAGRALQNNPHRGRCCSKAFQVPH